MILKNLLFFTAILLLTQSLYAQGCFPNGITFSTQAEVDAFATNFPNCTVFQGDVEIDGDDITNLNALSQITAIAGSLSLFSSDNLTDISG